MGPTDTSTFPDFRYISIHWSNHSETKSWGGQFFCYSESASYVRHCLGLVGHSANIVGFLLSWGYKTSLEHINFIILHRRILPIPYDENEVLQRVSNIYVRSFTFFLFIYHYLEIDGISRNSLRICCVCLGVSGERRMPHYD